jgi:long-chain acyl-CoA synthetase
MTNETLISVFMQNAANYADDIIIKYKKEKGGAYNDLTWRELSDRVTATAAGLIASGLVPGDRLAILSANRIEWIIADLATLLAGGIDVPIYHTSTAEQCAYVIADSGCRFVVVEDRGQLAKVVEKRGELKKLERIFLIEGTPPERDPQVVSFSRLYETGRDRIKSRPGELEKRVGAVASGDPATIVYTSGTTGPPKGCVLSHRNAVFVLNSIKEIIHIDGRSNLSLMILPISHFYPRVSGYYFNIYNNIPFAIAESLDTLGANMIEVRPTYFTSVPRIFEKVYGRITAAASQGSALKRFLFSWAVSVGRRRSRILNAHGSLPAPLRIQYAVADALVFKKIRAALGGRLTFALSAGAPLSAEVGEFIHSVGIQVLEFYGLTETVGGTMTTFDACKYGTVGRSMPGFEVKIAPDGEILMRGNNFLGYHNKPDLTAETIRDGWCYTGDIGNWDRDGYLVITDRKKDLIITSGGKNISPANIENLLKQIPLVSLPMVYGDNRNYLTAVITIDKGETELYAQRHGIPYASFEELTARPEIMEVVSNGVDRVNGALAKFETIKKFVILPREFSQEEGEITPTLKVKRRVIAERYRDLIESLYE